MTLAVLRESDADRSVLDGRTVAIIGYGNQGRAHALNLRDSGVAVVVGQRAGSSFDRAAADGYEPMAVVDATAKADLIVLTLPDESAAQIYTSSIASHLRPGCTLGFVHGFNIRYGFIAPPDDVDVIMVAPKGPGTLLRSLYKQGKGLPALMAIHQDQTAGARALALAWADAIGATRAGVVETTFAEETETDLFGEQAVLCGGITALTKAAFDTLVEAGYAPEFAYLECVHELKQIADLIYERGISAMRDRISNTAEYGDLTRGPQIVGPQTREAMRKMLDDIRSGAFAKEWIEESRAGLRRFRALHDADVDTPIEKAGEFVRSLMPWLGGDAAPPP